MESNTQKYSRGFLCGLSNCPACAEAIDNQKPKYLRLDDESLMPDEWQIYRCKNCTSTFINPQPAESSLPNLYQDYLTHKPVESDSFFTSQSLVWRMIRGYLFKRFSLQAEQSNFGFGYYVFMLIPPLRNKLDRYGRNLNNKVFKSKGKLLDFGCGAGEFLDLSARMGWKTYGCDFDPVVVETCKSKGFDVRLGDLSAFSSAEKFDVITLNQVIEHVTNPQQTINACYQALDKKGCLWIGTPNPNAHGVASFGAAWAGWHPPYHLCLPAQDELVHWMQSAGFSRVQVLQRGPHAKFNWNESSKLAAKYNIQIKNLQRLRLYFADFMNCFSPRKGEETVIVGFKD